MSLSSLSLFFLARRALLYTSFLCLFPYSILALDRAYIFYLPRWFCFISISGSRILYMHGGARRSEVESPEVGFSSEVILRSPVKSPGTALVSQGECSRSQASAPPFSPPKFRLCLLTFLISGMLRPAPRIQTYRSSCSSLSPIPSPFW